MADVAAEGVANEIALLEATDHALKRASQLAHLVAASFFGDRHFQIPVTHLRRRRGQNSQKTQHVRGGRAKENQSQRQDAPR